MAKKRAAGWVPIQHGAWAFVTLPFIVGMVPAGPTWVHVPLALFWLSGFFTFQAGSLWLKSRRARRYLPATMTYGAISACCGLITAVMLPSLLVWVPAFVPALAVAAWAAWRRKERTLVAGVATVMAACLMTLVAASAGSHPSLDHAAWCAAILFVYFAGTILYVKTMIRERGQQAWYAASVAYHAAAAAAAVAANWWVVSFFVVMTVRAAAGPRARWRVQVVGAGEFVASAALTLILLLAPLPA